MPPSRSAALRPPRAAIARNGRLRKGRGGAAAARARCRRAVEAVEHDGSPNEDVRSAPQKKPTSVELLIGDDGNWKVSENDDSEDDGKAASRRNKRRLEKKLTAGDTSCAEEREVVAPGEALQSDSKCDDGKLASSRRLKCHQMVKGISNGREESKAEVSEEISQSSSDGDGHKLASCKRSDPLLDNLTSRPFSDGGKSEADAFENSQTSQSSSEDEDRNLLPKRRSKRLREKPKAEYFNIEVSDNENTRLSTSNDDELCFGTCRRLKRLRYTLRDRKVANGGDAFKSVADTTSLAHSRRSKRLLDKLKDKDVPNESNSEVSHSSMLSAFSTSDDEFFGNTLKAGISTLSGVVCSICKNGVASNLFVQCRNSYCSLRFHNFCLDLPMQGSEGTLACPLCKVNQVSLAKSTKEVLPYVKKIQKLVGHRRVILPNSDFQCQFLVKWESLSHHHDCWVPLEWLYVFDRLRVQIYRKKHLLLKEVYSEDQRQPEWFEVDRAIACRMKSHPSDSCDILTALEDDKNFEEYEFLVKWKGLDYCEATWEPCCTEGVLPSVSMLVKRHQDAYKRVQCASETCLDGMEIVSEEINNGALYDYQLQGLQWIFTNFKAKRNVILADEMGLGKTVQVVCFLHHIVKGNFTTSPALVIAPKSILLQWEKEFFRWGRDLNVIVYQGVRESRKCIQVHEMFSSEGKALFDALVTSYEFVQLDKAVLRKFKWSTIVIDEAQRMKKLDCNLATCLKQYSSEFRLLLTGTPLQNNLLELFALLHYIDPDEFSDPKAEAELFSSIESGRKSLTLDEKITRIHEILKPRMLRRMKSDVLTDSIPIKKWVEVPCALTDSQRELYINIVEKNYLKLNNAIQSGRKIALNFILMELKKCCNHLYLFPGLEVQQQAEEAVFLSLVAASGKLQLLHKLLPRLKERGNRVLIFSQMTKMLDILEDFVSFMGYKYARIDGQTSLSARQESIKEYNNVESGTFIFLMSTRAGGLGVDLPGADRVIIYDPDFNPFMDLQAQSRAHRIGQTRPVVVYQLITKCSVEEKILQKSKQKLAIENILMNSSKKPSADELQSILLHGAKTIVDRNKVNAASIHYDEEAIENLLKLDPSPGEKCSSDDNGYLGSIVSFAHGVETEEEPLSPKAEDLKALQPVPKVVDLGRGKRQKKAVNYADENSDSDDMYAPESSSTARSSSSDDETESMVPEVVSVTDS